MQCLCTCLCWGGSARSVTDKMLSMLLLLLANSISCVKGRGMVSKLRHLHKRGAMSTPIWFRFHHAMRECQHRDILCPHQRQGSPGNQNTGELLTIPLYHPLARAHTLCSCTCLPCHPRAECIGHKAHQEWGAVTELGHLCGSRGWLL